MSHRTRQPTRVAIVGAGNVGSTFAYSLAISSLASEIVLIDANPKKAEGEAMDLNHAVPMIQPVRVWAGSFADTKGAAVTVITAGSAQRPGETRLDLVQRNASIFRSVVTSIVENNPEGIILVATNPVDVLSYATWKYSDLPASRVIGSGTILDTARFRYLLSQAFDVDPRSVHAYIIGEHGDSEVPAWSLTNIAGMKLADYCAMNGMNCREQMLEEIFTQTRDAAYHIIELKGATFYAIASGLVRIVEAILRDQSTVLSVSSLISNFYDIDDVYLSLPCILDRGGVERFIRLQLSPQEVEGLRKSASVLKETVSQLDLA